jgi:hypothetical protein
MPQEFSLQTTQQALIPILQSMRRIEKLPEIEAVLDSGNEMPPDIAAGTLQP